MTHKPELTLGASNALIELDAVGREWEQIVKIAEKIAADRNDDILRADIERAVEIHQHRA